MIIPFANILLSNRISLAETYLQSRQSHYVSDQIPITGDDFNLLFYGYKSGGSFQWFCNSQSNSNKLSHKHYIQSRQKKNIMRRERPLTSIIPCKWQCESIFCIIAFLFHLLLIMNLLNFLSNSSMLAPTTIHCPIQTTGSHETTPGTKRQSTMLLSQLCHRNIIKLNIKVSAAIRQFAFCTILNK